MSCKPIPDAKLHRNMATQCEKSIIARIDPYDRVRTRTLSKKFLGVFQDFQEQKPWTK